MTSSGPFDKLVHRMAVITTGVALLPIVVGALVTSMKAGMAFRDWPSSDGQFMLTYPWLADFVRGTMDKFVEHGHRLAGVLIGCTSILLVIVCWRRERRKWVRGMAVGVLLGVILQGLLGGVRVLADDPRLAMAHGNFAALVFCLMGILSLVTSRSWMTVGGKENIAADDFRNAPAEGAVKEGLCAEGGQPILPGDRTFLKILAVMTVLVVYGQYILGGQQRHLHTLLHAHLAGALATLIFTLVLAACAWRTGHRSLRWPSVWLVFILAGQLALGAGAWVTKFGFPPTGYVAVPGAPAQLWIRSGHTVTGMLLLLTTVALAVRIFRLARMAADAKRAQSTQSPVISRRGVLSAPGGAS